jgi:DNA ligase-1
MRFRELAELGERLESTTKRNEMVDLGADFLKRLKPEEVEPAVCMLLGRPFPKTSEESLEVSWATLRDLILKVTGAGSRELEAAFGRTGDLGTTTAILFESGRKRQRLFAEKPLELLEVQDVMREVARVKGSKARQRKERLLEGLLNRSDPLEAKYLVKIIIGEMRTGFQEGLMELMVAKAFGTSKELVQRASMFAGDIASVARLMAERGEAGIRGLKPVPFRPIKPMLAQVAEDVKGVIETHRGRTAFEQKLDGARIQIHKRGEKVRIFSRRLTDVTESLPEIVKLVSHELRAKEAILEGEVIAVGKDGFPLPFQSLLQRFRREREVERMAREVPLRLQLFDLLYLDGESLVDAPYEQRRAELKRVSGSIELTEQLLTSDPARGKEFLDRALRAGHEGLMAKEPGSPYTPGVRGKRWLKIKPVLEPLDLVIVGAEFGYGRRHEWLSDYYLAARDERTERFELVGKTFKGLTDEEIKEMTRRLEGLAVRRERRRVWVLPRVVEVAYNEIQRSPKYPCGMALRFARITRVRDDKPPEEADTFGRVREIYAKQVKKHR